MNIRLLIQGRWPYFVIVLVWLILTPPLMHPFFYHTHDGEHMFERVVELNLNFDHSPFGSRWLPHLAEGYGLPVFYFYPPLFFYFCSFLHFFSLTDAQTFRLVFSLTFLFSGFSMYILAKNWLPKEAACVSAVAYMAAPFHLVDIYTRGAPAQCISYIFAPLFFLFLIRAIEKGRWKDIALGAMSLAGLVLSYHLIAYMCLLISPIFLFAFHSRRLSPTKSIMQYGMLILLGMGLCSFYWLPMMILGQNLKLDNVLDGYASYKNHFLFLHELFEHDSGESNASLVKNPFRDMRFEIGLPYLFVLLGSLSFLFIENKRKYKRLASCLLAVAFISVFLMFPISQTLWEHVPYLAVVMFPWRFLFLVYLSCALLIGLFIWQLGRFRIAHYGTFSLLGLVLLTWYGTTCFKTTHDTKLLRATPGKIIATGSRACAAPATEFVLNSIKEFPPDAYPEKFHFLLGKGFQRSLKIWPSMYVADFEVQDTAVIRVDTFWFPGWTLSVDGKASALEVDPTFGFMTFSLPAGNHEVTLSLKRTGIEIAALILTVLFFTAWVFLSLEWLKEPIPAQTVKVLAYITVAVIVYRAPWQSYPPLLYSNNPPIPQSNQSYMESVVKMDLYAGDSWDAKRLAGSYIVPASDVIPHEMKVSDRVYSVRIQTNLTVLEEGWYSFQLEADEGAWLAIDDHLVVSISQMEGESREGSIHLPPGLHPLKIYYHNVEKEGKLSLHWKIGEQTQWVAIPGEQIVLPIDSTCENPIDSKPWFEVLTKEDRFNPVN